jgi:outer membrane biosynthesis protein TonB
MNLKAKIHLENQKNAAEGRLAVRLDFLKEKGSEGVAIQRDPVIRKIKAEIRKANYRLASIAAQEKLNAEKAQVKAEKLVKVKSNREKAPAEKPKPVAKEKVKPEKAEKPEPVAKEKVKPEKAEKPEPVAKEKVKPEKKKEPSPAAKSKK